VRELGPEELLDAADGLLSTPSAATAGWWARAAAVLIRSALEQCVDRAVSRRGVTPEDASHTAKLLVLPAILGEERTTGLASTWAQLSSATHVQGYGLPPTEGELRTWLATARRLVEPA
jgi:hypothetical protein